MNKDVFSYLDESYGELNNYVSEINRTLFTAPHSAIVKGRIFAEKLSQEVAKLENKGSLEELTQMERLRVLRYEADLEEEVSELFHTVRKIGNVAAHTDIEADLEEALKIHKCVYKLACWFVATYIDYQFEPEKYRSPMPELQGSTLDNSGVLEKLINKMENIMNITQEKVESIQKEVIVSQLDKESAENIEEESNNIVNKEVAIEESVDSRVNEEVNKECLIQELSKLKESSKEAVESLNTFSLFKKYMHITRDAQNELENIIINANKQEGAQLVLVCGSVGDGKSHIISYFKDKYPEIMGNFTLHNDATESLEPNKTSIDTLNEVLDNFSDEKISSSTEKFILAINLGTLNNFIDSEYGKRFSILQKYVSDKKILENSIMDNTFDSESNIQFINFSDYHIFTLRDGKVHSNYVKSLINKITDQSEINIFYNSYKKYCTKCKNSNCCPIKVNYELLSEDTVQNSIVDLLVQCIIKNKIIVSTRALLNFLHELIVARSYIDINSPMFKEKIGQLNNLQYIKSLTPNIIFDHKELSFIFEALNTLDPLNIRNEKVDDFVIKFNNSIDLMDFFKEYIDYSKGYLDKISEVDFEESEGKKIRHDLLKLFIRSYYLCGKGDIFSLKDEVYESFINNLYWWNKGEKSKLTTLYSEIKDGVIKWNGEADKNHINIFIGKNQTKYKTSEKLELKADTSNLPRNVDSELVKFLTTLELKYKSENLERSCAIEVDYLLYELLNKVTRGYRPNKKDKNQFIKFIEFISRLEVAGSQAEQLVFTEKNREINKKYRLEYDDEFEFYKFVEI